MLSFRRSSFWSFAAAGGLLGASVLAQQDPAAQPGSDAQQQGQQQQQFDGQTMPGDQQRSQQQQDAPEGFVLIEERVIVLTANEPQNHFLRAQEYLLQNDRAAAAAEARIAANYLELQSSRADDQAKQQLTSSAQRLTQIADKISPAGDQQPQQGQQQQGQQAQRGQADQQLQDKLTSAFVEANQALAQHFQSKAQKNIEKQNAVMAGHDLQAAADAFEAAVVWSQQQPSPEAAAALDEARQLAAELRLAGGANVGLDGWDEPQRAGDTDAAEAQPAAAREGQQQQQGQADRIPADASRTVEQLGQAIQSFSPQQQSGSGGGAGQSDPQQQP